MGCIPSSLLECPRCDKQITSGDDFIRHLESVHGFKDIQDQGGIELNTLKISCPKCEVSGFSTGDEFLEHLEKSHSLGIIEVPQSSTNVTVTNEVPLSYTNVSFSIDESGHSNLPKVGDKVMANWSGSIWQYFPATIRQFMKDQLKYQIDWDDGDSSGRIVDYYNLAVDRIPIGSEVGVGSTVLFLQGYYGGQEGVRTGGRRWHQGRITRVYTTEDGIKRYDGYHTKGEEDGKWVTYSGYQPTFEGCAIDELRVGPNVFDIIGDDISASTDDEEIDVYFSYTSADSPMAIKNDEVGDVPQSYRDKLDSICDPISIASNLKAKGLKVAVRNVTSEADLKSTVGLMKKAKVFIACISDQYVANEQCRMEFQFAKKSLCKPIVPLVVGDGSFEWTISVVGMLIAGELFIHFKDKDIESAKNNELIRSLRAHLPSIEGDDETDGDIANQSIVVEGPADIFISYCWTNSFKAKEAQQISKCVGAELSDPRHIKDIVCDMGYSCWLDIERLHSANNDAGMFEQLTSALRDAKVVLPCISSEYANSANCRMEFQFALKSLGKPVIPIVVGEGTDWEQTVIGALVSTNERDPVNMQNIVDDISFEKKMNLLKKEIEDKLGIAENESEEKPTKPQGRRAPQVGDHVVCHHFSYAYYMATVLSFDSSKMEYEVRWDDNDPSGRVQPYNQVAIDVVPDADDVGVGSIIFFPQGSYSGTEGNNEGGERYHEGVITSSRKIGEQILFSGHHTKGEDDDKWITYQSYNYEFCDMTLSQIRIAPTALDAFTMGTR